MVEKSHTAGTWPKFYEPLRNVGQKMAGWLVPASEASTTENSYKISLELPGVEEKDIDISVHDGVVVVKGEKTSQKEEKGETWFFSERQYGSFSRSFRLPEDADGNKVEAHLKDGVLQVVVPKAGPEAKQGTKVKINKG